MMFMMFLIRKNAFFLLILALAFLVFVQVNYLPYKKYKKTRLPVTEEYNYSQILSDCPIMAFQHDNEISMQYHNQSRANMDKRFAACELDKSELPVKIVNITELQSNVNHETGEMFHISINKTNQDLACQIIEIKRVSNISEGRRSFVDGERKSFVKYESLEAVNVTTGGYYKIECLNQNKSVVFDEVLALFPFDASKIIRSARDERNVAKSYIREKIKKVEPKPVQANPMLSDSTYLACEELSQKHKSKYKKMSVLMIGLDSVSYPLFKRNFPHTYRYLTRNLSDNALFEMVNVVGENTYPNMLPFLTGVVKEELFEHGLNDETEFYKKLEDGDTFHDLFPFIWNRFESMDYLTMLQEEADYSTFNYLKDGFRFQPTSIYLRPYWYKYLDMKDRLDEFYCHNHIPDHKRFLDVIKNLVEIMENRVNENVPYFSFNFMDHYTHDYLTIPDSYDFYLRDLIKGLEDRGYLDNTLFILFSDHGNRMTSYSDTDFGVLEKTNPFVSLRLPKALRDTEYYQNARHNTRKMVTPFDFYKTMQQFYYINKYPDELIDNSEGYNSRKCREYFAKSQPQVRSQRGVSVFEKLSFNRTCTEALVTPGYCNCKNLITINNETEYKEQTGLSFDQTAAYVMAKINEIADKVRDKCEPFRLDKVEGVTKIIRRNMDTLAYKIDLLCQPAGAKFDVMFKINKQSSTPLELIGKMIRANRYGSQSDCVSSESDKYSGFCYCK